MSKPYSISMWRLGGPHDDGMAAAMCFGSGCCIDGCQEEATHGATWNTRYDDKSAILHIGKYCRNHADEKQAEFGGLKYWDEQIPSREESDRRLRESGYKGPFAKAMEKANQAFWDAFMGEPGVLEDPDGWHRRRKAQHA